MPPSGAARHDLYNGLTELLGPQRAETLMAALPAFDTSDLATKSDVALMAAELRAQMSDLRAEFKSDLQQGFAAMNERFDRFFLAWMGGLVVILGAMIGLAFLP